MFECLGKEPVFICNTPLQFTAMDKVKWGLVHPIIFKVINLKYAIWRDPNFLISLKTLI